MTLSASILATPTMVERDLAPIKSVISGIGGKVDTLHTSIKSYNGGNTQSEESASDTLVDAINSGTAKVKGTEELDSMSALGLQKPVLDLKDQEAADCRCRQGWCNPRRSQEAEDCCNPVFGCRRLQGAQEPTGYRREPFLGCVQCHPEGHRRLQGCCQ